MRALSTLSYLSAVLAGTLSGAFARAQAPDNLIGLTSSTPLLYQRDHNSCTMLPFCVPPGFPPAPAQPYAGGTAWDPMRNGAVISNGFVIAEVDPNTCNYICPPSPAPTVSPNAVVTGLEVVESLNQIWMIDSFGALYQMTYGCPPLPIAVCNTGLPLTATNATGGLAVDEMHRLVFYSYSNWVTGANQIHIATVANPCVTIQIAVPTACPTSIPFRAITGLAVDGCRSVLYMTDGVQTIAWRYNVLPGPIVTFGPQSCCVLPMPAIDTMIGLAVRTGGATSMGVTCANGSCPTCTMNHTLRGSPNLGNAAFGLEVDSAPLTSFVFCGIGIGPCMPAPVFAPLCGPLYIGPLVTILGAAITPTGVGCSGPVGFNLGLPADPALCGAVLSSQFVVLCAPPTGAPGWSMSNCLSWQLQSN